MHTWGLPGKSPVINAPLFTLRGRTLPDSPRRHGPSVVGRLLGSACSGHPALDFSCHPHSTQPDLCVTALSLQCAFWPEFAITHLYRGQSLGPRSSSIPTEGLASLQYSFKWWGFFLCPLCYIVPPVVSNFLSCKDKGKVLNLVMRVSTCLKMGLPSACPSIDYPTLNFLVTPFNISRQ